MSRSQKADLEITIKLAYKVVKMFEWLLNLYVLDFFVDDHWSKLPDKWRESFQNVEPDIIGDMLSGKPVNRVFPLSFLAFLKTVHVLSVPRKKQSFETINEEVVTSSRNLQLKNLFLKHVKLKKRHEISLMSYIVRRTAEKSDCDAVVDFGSGLGHLVRILAYKHNMYACGIECQSSLTMDARKLDLELEYTASKHLSKEELTRLRRPEHINLKLTSDDQLNSLSSKIEEYGLIGLHPCGDLGPLLLKHFAKCKNVKFICIVGCCYMKLTSDGYPMSQFVRSLDHTLSYASKEIACHAIEVYIDRLTNGNYENLKVHAYRAALERMLVESDPKLKHTQVRSIKHSETMTFHRYCTQAVEKLGIVLPSSPEIWCRGESDVARWRHVVIMYTLRLALAPLVETVLLLDRLLYVIEHGFSCNIQPVFDPKISPRNHIIIARRM